MFAKLFQGLVHEITDQCGDVCVCVHEKKKKKKRKKKSCCLLSCGVKVLKVYGYGGSCRELKQMRHFLENLRFLEIVKVQVQVDQQDTNYLPLTNDIIKLLPRASSKCKIQFIWYILFTFELYIYLRDLIWSCNCNYILFPRLIKSKTHNNCLHKLRGYSLFLSSNKRHLFNIWQNKTFRRNFVSPFA